MTSLLLLMPFLAQESSDAPEVKSPGPVFWVCYFAIILLIAAMWKVFSKAGQPGWGDHSNLQRLRDVQSRGTSGLVADPVPDPNRELYHRDHHQC